jgi:outer membrane protein OmpA-like peptidoglycan-associated protein
MTHIGVLSLVVFLALPGPADAQVGGMIRRAVREAARKTPADSAKEKAAADSIRADSIKAAAAKAPSSSAPAPAAPAASPGAPAKQDAKIWDNYDFVPGSKVILFTDFTEDRVGNFARGLRYVGGPIEVVERDGAKVLRSTGRATILIPVGRVLPQRFTLEIDVLSSDKSFNDQVVIEGGRTLTRGDQSAEITWNPNGTFILGSGQNAATSPVKHPDAMVPLLVGQVAHVRILFDSAYFKMYTNERRLYNNPDLAFRRDSVIRMMVGGTEEHPTFITSIRLAESEHDVLYDELMSKGRWVTQGILFETGKADLKPESKPVLKEIAATLKQYGDLKVLIEGHTDNVGGAASNLTLSEARAAAVKAALVSEYGADGARITTRGLGDTQPAAPNTTASGRAQNRRVEVVKQ